LAIGRIVQLIALQIKINFVKQLETSKVWNKYIFEEGLRGIIVE
jgi:hypothetical protein